MIRKNPALLEAGSFWLSYLGLRKCYLEIWAVMARDFMIVLSVTVKDEARDLT